MLNIEQPEDIMGLALYNVFNYRKEDPKFIHLVLNWNKIITFDIEQLYSLHIIFEGNSIKFKVGNEQKSDLTIKTDFNTILNIALGKVKPFKSVMQRKIKMKGFWKIKTTIRFFKIFVKSIKMISEDSN